MKLSQEARYGLEGLVALARQPPGTVMPLSDIAVADRLPRFFLAKIFQKLTQHGVLRSSRGAVRGYALARPPRAITLQQILTAIEGPDLLSRCIFWSRPCSDADPCPLHQWKLSQRLVEEVMKRTLADVVKATPRRTRATRKKRGQVRRGRRA